MRAMWTRNMVAFVALVLVLGGCATRYGANGLGGGYTDTRIDDTHARVSFRGNGYTSRERVESYLLLRAAEVTRDAGFTWFEIVDGETERRDSQTPDQTTCRVAGQSATCTTTPGISFSRYGATALIVMGRGKRPASARTFNAESVIERVGATAER